MHNGHSKVGILAVQGDFELHARVLDRIGAAWKLVKEPKDLEGIAGLIMPGGESTTMLKLLHIENLFEPLLTYDYLARPYRLVPGTAAALPEISDDGRTIVSETDTEVISHLIDRELTAGRSLLQATRAAIARLRGSYAMLVTLRCAGFQVESRPFQSQE